MSGYELKNSTEIGKLSRVQKMHVSVNMNVNVNVNMHVNES